jgi:hypothetical protein
MRHVRFAVWLVALGGGLAACAPSSSGSGDGTSRVDPGQGGNGGSASAPVGPAGAGGAPFGFEVPDAGPNGPLLADAGCEGIRSSRPVAPTVMIVLDRSGSMLFGGEDRWTPAVDAIEQLTASLGDRIRFGLTVFPSLAGLCSSGEQRVAPALEASGAIAADLRGPSVPVADNGTPTAAALVEARAALAGLEGTRYVLLVTDGAPNCNADADAQTCDCTGPVEYCQGGDLGGGAVVAADPLFCLDREPTLAALGDLEADGIQSFVIGYDTSQWAATLDAMAVAGGTGRTTHFAVSDGAALQGAFEEISAHVVSCTFELEQAPPSYRYVSVSVDGERVEHISETDGTYGWQLTGDRIVELVGGSCGAVSDGEPHEVIVVRECRPVIR